MLVIRVGGVNKVRAKGRIYYYDRRTKTRLRSKYGTQAFLDELAAIRAGGVMKAPPKPGTLGALILAYRASPEFLGLAPRTRTDYEKVFDWVADLGKHPVSLFDAPTLHKLRDCAFEKRKRRFANYVIQVMRLLFTWSIPRGYIADNPARDVAMIPRPRDARRINRAWTNHELIVVMNAAPPELKLATALGAYIGMREGDMLALPWSAYDGSWLRFNQGKTGTPLEIPAHRDLRPIIETTAKRSTIMVTGARGHPFTGAGFRARFFKLLRELQAKRLIGSGLTFHGLRHTATKNLLDAGCDPRTVMAITGHRSEAAFSVYAREADQRRRAKVGIARLERKAPEA